jgi:hypothetical protein
MKLTRIIPLRRKELLPEKDGWAWELKLDGFIRRRSPHRTKIGILPDD